MIKLLAIFAFTVLFLGCNNAVGGGGFTPPPRVINPLLVGGSFSDIHPSAPHAASATIFSFTSTSLSMRNAGGAVTTSTAWSRNGEIFVYEDVQGIYPFLLYAFVNPSEFYEAMGAAISSGNQQQIFNIHTRLEKARSGFYVRFTALGQGFNPAMYLFDFIQADW